MTTDTNAMLERESELALVDRALSSARDAHGSVVLIEGAPGLGKTTLLAKATERADERGFRSLAGRGRELECEFSFGVARQLFEPAIARMPSADRDAVLADRANAARWLLLGSGDAPPTADARFMLVRGLFWLAVNLAARQPLLLCVDDLQWADPASQQAIAYIAPRIDDLPVVLIAATRSDSASAEIAAVADAAGANGVTELTTLSGAASGALIREAAADATDAYCAACHRVTAGNPQLLHELLAGALRDGIASDDEGAARIASLVPETVSRAALARIGGLGPDARALAAAVSVLERGELRDAAMLADLDDARAASAAAALAQARVLDDALPLAFLHPIIRTAIYTALPAAERSLAHADAARLLSARSADPEVTASHLLLTEARGDASMVPPLCAAADRALEHGLPESAVRFLRRAVEEADRGAAVDIGALRLALGRAELASGDPACISRLRAALAAFDEPAARVTALDLLSAALHWHGERTAAVDTAYEAVMALPDNVSEQVALRLFHFYVVGARAMPGRLSEVRALLDIPCIGALEAARLNALSFDRLLSGGPLVKARELARSALAHRAMTAAARNAGFAQLAIYVLGLTDEIEEAERALDPTVESALQRGERMTASWAVHLRAVLRWRKGLVPQAAADCELAIELGASAELVLVTTRAILARCWLELGDLDVAERALHLEPDLVARLPGTWSDHAYRFVRGQLRAARGDLAGALSDALAVGDNLASIDVTTPVYLPWRSLAALAACRLGDRDLARRLCREDIEVARRVGAGRATGIALTTTGVVEEDIELLRQGANALAGTPAALERVWALIELGARLRRDRQSAAAREPLREAMRVAQLCGATARAERAYQELMAAGARPRRDALHGPRSLTPRELRVAELAAAGSGNREIAETLFITRKTVETHLRNIFYKLSVSSREQLGDVLDSVSGPQP